MIYTGEVIRMQSVRKHSRKYQLLKYLALGSGVLILVSISPASGAHLAHACLRAYVRKKQFARARFLQDLKNLQTKKLVNYQERDDGSVKITLTRQGKKKSLEFQLEDIKLVRPKRWDRKWYLVMFDIPHAQKAAREALREKLRELKFYPIQKSVFITPYPCKKEIDFITTIFEVQKYVLVFSVDYFEGEEKLRNRFGI